MKIFIQTLNFLGVKSIIEICEYTFKYGSKDHKNVPILVGDSDPEFWKVPPQDDLFIFIFAGISKDKVKDGLAVILEKYNKNKRKAIFVIVETEEKSPYHPKFTYSNLGFKEAPHGFDSSHFLIHNTVGFEQELSRALRNVIFKLDL